jgi:hypothetical protein
MRWRSGTVKPCVSLAPLTLKLSGGTTMLKQKDMEDAMLFAHKNFMTNLEKSLDILAKELKEAQEMTFICNDEWCNATESVIDDLHKSLYAISEPRWLPKKDSEKLKNLRTRIRDLYRDFAKVAKRPS